MTQDTLKLLPRFCGVSGERFFTMQWRGAATPVAHIVFLPSFAEEMNRCRSLVATQARAFAAQGYWVTAIDYYGTGDSDGELSDSSLARWYDNIDDTLTLLSQDAPAPIIFWGMRLGCLMALDYAAKHPGTVSQMVLWQPVTGGKLYVTQLLRQRVASLMMRDKPAETTKEIRQRLVDGHCVEVGGYTLGNQMLDDVEGIDLKAMSSVCAGKIHWLEHVMEEGKAIGVAAQRAIDTLVGQGNDIDVHTFSDPQIWQIHERDFAPQLLASTGNLAL